MIWDILFAGILERSRASITLSMYPSTYVLSIYCLRWLVVCPLCLCNHHLPVLTSRSHLFLLLCAHVARRALTMRAMSPYSNPSWTRSWRCTDPQVRWLTVHRNIPLNDIVFVTARVLAVVMQCGADSLTGDRIGKFNLTVKGTISAVMPTCAIWHTYSSVCTLCP